MGGLSSLPKCIIGGRRSPGKGNFTPERGERAGQPVHGMGGPGHGAEGTEDSPEPRRPTSASARLTSCNPRNNEPAPPPSLVTCDHTPSPGATQSGWHHPGGPCLLKVYVSISIARAGKPSGHKGRKQMKLGAQGHMDNHGPLLLLPEAPGTGRCWGLPALQPFLLPRASDAHWHLINSNF